MSEGKRETTFENAKVGDRVYSPLFKSENPDDKTNACIIRIDAEKNYPLIVRSDVNTGHILNFKYNGNYVEVGGQCLFWENPIKEIPVRPKRKVVKKGYCVVIPCAQNRSGCIGVIVTELYASHESLVYGTEGKQLKSIELEVEE